MECKRPGNLVHIWINTRRVTIQLTWLISTGEIHLRPEIQKLWAHNCFHHLRTNISRLLLVYSPTTLCPIQSHYGQGTGVEMKNTLLNAVHTPWNLTNNEPQSLQNSEFTAIRHFLIRPQQCRLQHTDLMQMHSREVIVRFWERINDCHFFFRRKSSSSANELKVTEL